MLSFKNLFQEYLIGNNKNNKQLIEEEIQKKMNSNDFYFGENCEMIFLYRQARTFNIQSKIPFNEYSDYYKEKREKILQFLSLIKGKTISGDSINFFVYNQKTQRINIGSFLCVCATFGVKNKTFNNTIIDEMKRLFDIASLSEYAFYFLSVAKEENVIVPITIKTILDFTFNAKQKQNYIDEFLYLQNNCENINDKNVKSDYFDISIIDYSESMLTDRSKCFLLLADACVENLVSTSFFDFSIITLQYYKVIEVELKEKIIKEAIKETTQEKVFFSNNNKYIKKGEKEFKFLTLEGINTIFEEAITSLQKTTNDNSNSFYSCLLNVCNNDIRYLTYFRDITSANFRNRYRNPPAHTDPSPAEYAKEIKYIFASFIDNLRKILKKDDSEPTRFNVIDKVLKSNNYF